MLKLKSRLERERPGKKGTGFTLIELMVTVAIIAILMTVAIVQYRSTNQRSRDKKRKADFEQIRAALEMYRIDCRQYPATSGLTFGSSLNGAGVYCPSSPVYMPIVPQDPQNDAQSYTYVYSQSSNTVYFLCGFLELGRSGNEQNCGIVPSANCGGVTCNYGLTQP